LCDVEQLASERPLVDDSKPTDGKQSDRSVAPNHGSAAAYVSAVLGGDGQLDVRHGTFSVAEFASPRRPMIHREKPLEAGVDVQENSAVAENGQDSAADGDDLHRPTPRQLTRRSGGGDRLHIMRSPPKLAMTEPTCR